MDEKLTIALQDYVATANSNKYSNWEELNSKFPELKKLDPTALQDYVATANSGKYSSWEELNSKFPEFDVGKQGEVSGQGSQNTSETSTEPAPVFQEPKEELIDFQRDDSGNIHLPEGYQVIEDRGGLGDNIDFVYVTPEGEEVSVFKAVNIESNNEFNNEGNQTISNRIGNYINSMMADFNANLASTPEFLYNLAGSGLNLLAEGIGQEIHPVLGVLLREDYDQTYQKIQEGKLNPLRLLAEYAQNQSEIAEHYTSLNPEGYGDIAQSISDGNYLRAGEELLANVIGAVPTLVYLGVTGATGGARTISQDLVRKTAVTLPFSSGNYMSYTDEDLSKMNKDLVPFYSLLGGVVEILDAEIGASSLIREGIRNKTISSKGVQDIITGYAEKAFKNAGILKKSSYGAVSEGIIRVSQNAINKYSGRNEDINLLDGVANSMMVGAGLSGSVATVSKVGSVLKNKKTRDEVNALETELDELVKEVDNITDELTQEAVQERISDLVDEINTKVDETQNLENLTEQELEEVIKKNEEIIRLKNTLDNLPEETSEQTRKAIELKIEKLNKEQEVTEVESEVTEQAETTDVDTVESTGTVDTEVVEEVATPNFFETLTKEEARTNRISEIEASIKQQLKDAKNLGVQLDQRQKVKEDLKFLRDLTEYAVLKIADGTVKTAEAFSNLAKNIGDFGEDVLNKAYYNAREIASEYVKTNPTKEGLEEGQANVLTRLQEVGTDRTSPKTKVTSKKVKEITEGKITGKVTLTNKQALAQQIRTLNRGARDSIKNVKEIQGRIIDYIKEVTKRGELKGVKFTPAQTRMMADVVRGVTGEAKINKALEVVDKIIRDGKFRKKMEGLKALQKIPAKKIPADLKNTVSKFSKITPRDLLDTGLIDQYIDILTDFRKYGIKEVDVSISLMNNFINLAEANRQQRALTSQQAKEARESDPKWQAEQLGRKREELKDLGYTESEIETLTDPSMTFQEQIDKMVESIESSKKTRLDVIRETSGELLKGIKDNIDLITDQMSKSDARELNEFLERFNLKDYPDKYLLPLNYVLNNILSNSSIYGLGRIKSLSNALNKLNNAKERNTALGLLRKLKGFGKDAFKKKTLATITVRLENLIKDTRQSGQFFGYFGYRDYDLNNTKARKEQIKIRQDVDNILKKWIKKGGKNYWTNNYNNAISGFYTIYNQYVEGWTPEQIETRQKGIIRSLDRSIKMMEEIQDKYKIETFNDRIKTYKDILKEVASIDDSGNITILKTPEDIFKLVPEGYKEYYKYARDFFDKNRQEFFTVNRMYGNQEVQTGWKNYFPMVEGYKDLYKEVSDGVTNRASDIDLTEIINGFGLMSTTRELSGSGLDRTLQFGQLPKDRILDLNLLNSFERQAGKMLYDINTIANKWDMNYMTDIKNNGLESFGTDGYEVATILSLRGIIADRIMADQTMVNQDINVDPELGKILYKTLRTVGTAGTLGGFAQLPKQTTPIFEVMGRVKNQGSIVTALQYITTNRDAVQHILDAGELTLRKQQEHLFGFKQQTKSLDKEVEVGLKSIAKTIGIKYNDLLDKAGRLSLTPLILTDQGIAQLGWLSFYIDHVTDGGKKPFNIQEPINKNSVFYSNNQTSVTMNVTDQADQGGYATSNFRFIQPMMGFSTNSIHNLMVSTSKLKDAIAKSNGKDITRYSREVVGNFVNAVSFTAISQAVRVLGLTGSVWAIKQALEQGVVLKEDEERRDELMEMVLDEMEKSKLISNARFTSYVLTDFLTRGVLSNAVTPIIEKGLWLSGATEAIYGKEELMQARYQPATPRTPTTENPLFSFVESYAPVLGVAGMGASKYIEYFTNMSNAFKNDEDYIKATRGVVDAEGTEIIVNDYDLTDEGIEEFGIPKYMRYNNYISAIISAVGTVGLSDQTVNTISRNTKIVSRKLAEKERGKERRGSWEKTLLDGVGRFMEVKITDEDKTDLGTIHLSPEQVRTYHKFYLNKVEEVRGWIGSEALNSLTKVELEKGVMESAVSLTKIKIQEDYINESADLSVGDNKKLKAYKELEYRNKVIELQKKMRNYGKTNK